MAGEAAAVLRRVALSGLLDALVHPLASAGRGCWTKTLLATVAAWLCCTLRSARRGACWRFLCAFL